MLAKLAERAERYDDMVEYMKERVELGVALTLEERDLLSAAYKGALSSRRHAIRVALCVEKQEGADGRTANATLSAGYRSKVEAEMKDICVEVINLLSTKLLPKAENGEPQTFYSKMKADYLRYMAEISIGEVRNNVVEEAKAAYVQATEEAATHLLATHPVRLGLALNFSVFQHEVLGKNASAVQTVQEALLNAATILDSMPEEAVEDAMLTMQLLKENLVLWESEI